MLARRIAASGQSQALLRVYAAWQRDDTRLATSCQRFLTLNEDGHGWAIKGCSPKSELAVTRTIPIDAPIAELNMYSGGATSQ